MNLRVKDIIREKGMTVQELADQMGINRVTLSNSINGNPTLETLEKIATALNVSITELFSNLGEDLYGVVLYNGLPHKVDSVEALKQLLSKIEANQNNRQFVETKSKW